MVRFSIVTSISISINVIDSSSAFSSSPSIFNNIYIISGRYNSNSVFAFKKSYSTSSDSDPDSDSESEEDNKSLKKEEKQVVVDAIKKYDEVNPRPKFRDPGHPDYEEVTQESKSVEEFHYALEKFCNNYTIESKLQKHDEKCKEAVVASVEANHPNIPSEKVAEYIDKKQEAQRIPYDERDFPLPPGNFEEKTFKKEVWPVEKVKLPVTEEEKATTLNKKEAEWRTEIYSDSMMHESDKKLKSEDDEDFTREHTYEDSLFGHESSNSDYSVLTPTAAVSPSPEKKSKEKLYEVSGSSDSDSESEAENPKGTFWYDDEGKKRQGIWWFEEPSNKRQKLDDKDKDKDKDQNNDKQSPIDYTIEKQSTEMPDITESDGGD